MTAQTLVKLSFEKLESGLGTRVVRMKKSTPGLV